MVNHTGLPSSKHSISSDAPALMRSNPCSNQLNIKKIAIASFAGLSSGGLVLGITALVSVISLTGIGAAAAVAVIMIAIALRILLKKNKTDKTVIPINVNRAEEPETKTGFSGSVSAPTPAISPPIHKESERKTVVDESLSLQLTKPMYTKKTNINRKYESIWHKSFITKLLAKYEDKPEFAPFFAELVKIIERNASETTTEHLDYPTIWSPNKEVLELQAAKYAAKYKDYGVTIRVTHIDQLTQVLEQLKKTHREAIYSGIIVGSDEQMMEHVIPLLFYFGAAGTETRKVSCVAMDVLGDSEILRNVIKKLVDSNEVSLENMIAYDGLPRQADINSCRTGAIILLCNALLSLKYYKQTDGFLDVLGLVLNIKGHSIQTLPAQWTYAEQIIRSRPEGRKGLHIRDLVSNKKEKSENPRTIEKVRQAHKESVRIKYTIINREVINVLKTPPPPGVEVNGNSISFVLEILIDVYLLKKGRRCDAQLKSESDRKEGPSAPPPMGI